MEVESSGQKQVTDRMIHAVPQTWGKTVVT